MEVIDAAKLGAGREDYYLRQVAEDREAYLTGHGEAPGYVLGTAAPEALALSGEVTAEQFRQLFVGEHPATGELLGRRHRKDGVLAYDFVFRPTKSVSLLYGLGDREEAAAALAAHHAGCVRRWSIWSGSRWCAAVVTAWRRSPRRGCWPWGSITGRAGLGIRCCTRT
ncbi:MAG: relaxase domain-containing protein [Stenotrophomonas sp.]|uniref:relaxase domain-containing protein n=1 Tax=Stenotrophomonas sp. TaxID=69392 RepID=UPI003D6D31A8